MTRSLALASSPVLRDNRSCRRRLHMVFLPFVFVLEWLSNKICSSWSTASDQRVKKSGYCCLRCRCAVTNLSFEQEPCSDEKTGKNLAPFRFWIVQVSLLQSSNWMDAPGLSSPSVWDDLHFLSRSPPFPVPFPNSHPLSKDSPNSLLSPSCC